MTETKYKELVILKFLSSIEGIGPQKIFNLLSKFHSFENILIADIKDLQNVDGLNVILCNKIINQKKYFEEYRKNFDIEFEKLNKINARIITYFDDEYPELLKNIYFPPIILYTVGNLELLKSNSISIVGTRVPSNYGKTIAEKFSIEISNKNIAIISGLARGIDSIVHNSVLNNNGKTIAVIGTGIDVIYPPENKLLFERIRNEGLIISEYELGTKPDAQNFPRRNRIISGLSSGTLVIETKITGGALITAAYALEQGREVFAIPGQINSKQSEGTNSLIQKGEAKLVTCVEDILSELKFYSDDFSNKKIKFDNPELTLFEEKIYNVLDSTPKHIDEISINVNMPTSECLVHLLTLEFKGLVKQLPGKTFVLS
ncbi:MAG: DNA-processing protein DprA [Melioribacteraceae bacterium]|nr:DNA-processing protein DprA [Melioribacteraceae bacterium]